MLLFDGNVGFLKMLMSEMYKQFFNYTEISWYLFYQGADSIKNLDRNGSRTKALNH